MARLERKHSLATRLFHWTNAPVLAVMIWSGLLIYWANDVYEIRLGGITLVKFFPTWFYRALHVDHRLAEGMAWHFTFMWFFAINGLLYVTYTFWSGEWRELVPNRHTFAEAWQVVLHDLGIRKQPLPTAQVQRGAAAGLYRRGRDGGRLTADGPGHLQASPARLAHHAAGRLPAGAARAFRAGRRLRRLLCHPHHPGHPCRVEQFPRDGHRCRGGERPRRPFMEPPLDPTPSVRG